MKKRTLFITFGVIIAFVIVSGATENNASARGGEILIIHGYSKDLDWTPQQEEGFKNALGANYDYDVFYMNTKNLSPDAVDKKAAEALDYYRKSNPALVYTTDENDENDDIEK